MSVTPDAAAGSLRALIEQLAHWLPSQGPISVFVHHNTLHAFEDASFSEGVERAADLYDCHPYLPEEEYRQAVARGRIDERDLQEELFAVLGEDGDRLIGRLGTRHDLWMAMLRHPLKEGADCEVRWFLEETDALLRFRPETEPSARRRIMGHTRRWVASEHPRPGAGTPGIEELAGRFGGEALVAESDDRELESLSLQLLWRSCLGCLEAVPHSVPVTDDDAAANRLVNEAMMRFCAAFLDQGYAAWTAPQREEGFLTAFLTLYAGGRPAEPWLADLPEQVRELGVSAGDAATVVEQALRRLGVAPSDRAGFLRDQLLQLKGWAGTLWQMETNAEWAPRPAPRGSLVEYVAARLLLLESARRATGGRVEEPAGTKPVPSELNEAFVLMQIAEVRGWSGPDLLGLSDREKALLVEEVRTFPSRRRRQVYQQAYERHYRERALAALRQSATHTPPSDASPAFQVVFCIDDREESLRRLLEEVDPGVETYGFAGFFGVPMYYRGLGETHYRPLCPVNMKPLHHIDEEPLYSEIMASRRRAAARRAFGMAAQGVTLGSRSLVGGLLAGVFGAVTTLPLVLRVVAPRLASNLLGGVDRIVRAGRTRLRLETPRPSGEGDRTGFTVSEMADIVEGLLRTTGVPSRWSPLVVIGGHGSSSLNNPHAAAYDCGACGGGRGGPNARAFAQMANDHRVRALLAERGLTVPAWASFLGAYHNTCDDSVSFYDIDSLPSGLEPLLERVRDAFEEARRLNAQERARRFESAPLDATPDQALRHVEGRAADLSQVRSECGHATNALCLVGRRAWSRGLFLDRRAFLASYDPLLDDNESSLLAKLLGAVVPVCAGINLEYYFSRVDNAGYGCGTKLPHNVVSLLGVMDGAGSDLRTGLPWQMVEIHEPMRILFVVESTPETIANLCAGNPTIDTLVRGGWVQLASIDPGDGSVRLYERGEFRPFAGPTEPLPTVPSSADWRRGSRDHLGFALIGPGSTGGPR